MALTIYQNLFAMNSQKSLGTNQIALGKSLERLSSGLRINHASDDASGLAISEKMRGQISGLKRASMNSQDGISYLQTAEGAMEQVTSILQRMRELSVQAANGIYTTNDRAEIQKEVDQLKQEIDRISTATEFNTRKLINGDGTAIWSADAANLKAIIRGPVREGNYEISMSSRPGTNMVLKSDIMTLNEDAIGAELVSSGTNTSNINAVSDPVSMPRTGTAFFTATVATAMTTDTINVAGVYTQQGSSWTIASNDIVTASHSGYMEVEITKTLTASGVMEYRMRFIDAETGSIGAWISATGTTALAITAAYTTGVYDIQMSATVTLGTNGTMKQGDKILFAVSSDKNVSTPLLASGAGTIQLTGGPSNVTGPVITYTGVNSLTIPNNGDNIADKNNVKVYYVDMDPSNGNINLGNITLSFGENGAGAVGTTLSGSATIAVRGGSEAATTSTQLKDISRFVDGDGNKIFENKQELKIYGNGKIATIHIEGSDTIAILEEKLTKAIVKDLGMGSTDPEVNNHLVDYVSLADPTGLKSVKGTFIIQTAMTGEQGELAFIGDQSLIDALSLATVQKPTSNSSVVTVKDAHTGEVIGTENTGDDRVYGVIDGVELVIDSRAGVSERWDRVNNRIAFESDPNLANKKMHIHIVDNRTKLQIGANKGQDLDVSIPQLDLYGLGLENTVVVSQDHARRAIVDIDRALTMVVSARATVGAQVSRLEHTIENLAAAKENIAASESRIRDLDVAEETTRFTNSQMLVQAGVAMLAQANQIPQMVLSLIKG